MTDFISGRDRTSMQCIYEEKKRKTLKNRYEIEMVINSVAAILFTATLAKFLTLLNCHHLFKCYFTIPPSLIFLL